MKKIETLASIDGRILLQEIFRKLRYEKQLSGISSLFRCWRICTTESNFQKYVDREVSVMHPLGFFSGTRLWMEEVVNRFYFSTINSFVYFGAAILLVLIGVRRFSEHVSDSMVIGGVIFEALMLVFVFIIMLFSPNDEIYNGTEESTIEDLIGEVGEIGRDFAALVILMEKISTSLNEITYHQNQLLESIREIIHNSALAVSPNNEMLEAMKSTNIELGNFKDTVSMLNNSIGKLKHEEIERTVRKELENLIAKRIPE